MVLPPDTTTAFYASADFMYRDAENYKAGKNREVAFSQFSKYNFSGTFGYFLNKRNLVEASVIYDKATDVGYPHCLWMFHLPRR